VSGKLWRRLQARPGLALVVVLCAVPVHLFFFGEGWGAAVLFAVVLAVVGQLGEAATDAANAWRRRRSPVPGRVGER